jgi:DNA-binding transcriptional ArsR family regulator
MRKSSALDALFPQTRQGILAAALIDPSRAWYLSNLARHLGLPPSSLQRELARLTQTGILRQERDGNRVTYQANLENPLVGDLRNLILKTVGICDVLRAALGPIAHRVKAAFVFGSMAKGAEQPASDVELMVIGSVGLSEVVEALKSAEEQLGRAINPSIYSEEEAARKVKAGHYVLETVLNDRKLFLIGGQDDLAAVTGKRPR